MRYVFVCHLLIMIDIFCIAIAMQVTASHPGHEPKTQTVTVSDSSATVLGFVLDDDSNAEWSRERDFGLRENLVQSYLSATQLDAELADLENRYPDNAEVFMNEADWSTVVSAVKISGGGDDNVSDKAVVAFFGGVYASQPAGREILLRFARHLLEGIRRGDSEVTTITDKVDIFVLPAVDQAGFDQSKEGRCDLGSMRSEAGSKMTNGRRRGGPEEAGAVAGFLRAHRVDAALSLEAGGVFVRLPWDDPDRERAASSESDPSLKFLAREFLAAHDGMRATNGSAGGEDNDDDDCGGRAGPSGIVYGHQLPEYSGTILDLIHSQVSMFHL